MKTTRHWWSVISVLALGCEAAEDVEGNDDERGVCETGGEACGPAALAEVEAAHEGGCGSQPTAFEVAVMEDDFNARLTAAPPGPRAATKVPVYVHVISQDSVKGNVPDSQIEAQIEVLNQKFAGTSFSFELKEVDRTVNSAWYTMGMDSAAESQAKSALRRGDRKTLNIYIVDAVSYLGWATFPWWSSFDLKDDGIVIDNITLPGGANGGYMGVTAVHEVGHWLGLYHTFQNGCSWFGDFVGDTRAEKSPATGCPVGRDTCSGGGPDPITNYMDYTTDACKTGFTSGQRSRMSSQYGIFR